VQEIIITGYNPLLSPPESVNFTKPYGVYFTKGVESPTSQAGIPTLVSHL
jgi:hypothetical protein